MSQLDIRKHLDKLHELGKYFIKKTITIKDKEGTKVIEQFVRGASDQRFTDSKTGEFDDEEFRNKSEIDRHDSLMILYHLTKTELINRGDDERVIPIEDEADYFEDDYKLFGWIMDELRFLGIDVPHDRYWKSTVMKEGVPIGQKSMKESQAIAYAEKEGG